MEKTAKTKEMPIRPQGMPDKVFRRAAVICYLGATVLVCRIILTAWLGNNTVWSILHVCLMTAVLATCGTFFLLHKRFSKEHRRERRRKKKEGEP